MNVDTTVVDRTVLAELMRAAGITYHDSMHRATELQMARFAMLVVDEFERGGLVQRSEHSVEPIGPDDLTSAKKNQIPKDVINVFNTQIAKHYASGRAVVKQSDVVSMLLLMGISEDLIYSNNWLNVEEIYREAGWSVVYDKPAYYESYPATFTFSKGPR